MTDLESEACSPSGRVITLQGSHRVHWPVDSERTRTMLRFAVALSTLGLLLGVFFMGRPTSIPFILGMIVAIPLPWIPLVGVGIWRIYFSPTHQGTASGDSRGAALPRWSPDTDEEVGQAIASWFDGEPRAHPDVIAVCHASIPPIVGFEGPPHLLEEEPLIDGDARILGGRLLLGLNTMIGAAILLQAISGGGLRIPLIQLVPFVILPSIPIGIMLLRRVRSRALSQFITGAGFIRDTTTGRVVTVEDAVMFVRPSQVTAGDSAFLLDADLIGRDLRLRLKFRSPHCREFKALWERWCHPNPRPELAGVDRD